MSRGHDLQALLHDYPIDLVANLHRAAMENHKEEIKAQVLGFSVAVLHGLDMALGGGKGKILDSWLKGMDGPAEEAPDQPSKRSPISEKTAAFFEGAPVKIVKGG